MGAESKIQGDAADPLLGRVIAERFRVLAPIARGGMGQVYKAEQLPLGRLVALKVLDARYRVETETGFQKRFFLEASCLAKLSHPNTVTVFDYGRTEDGIFYIAMEYVEGKTLRALLAEQAPFAVPRALSIAAQIARSLREAHSFGVIHRDLKPANIIVSEHGDQDDFVKVLDFGLVKNLAPEADDEVTSEDLFMGSPKYMSPEQVNGNEVDGRSDIYSLGVVLYEMLTAHVPFAGGTSVDTLMSHLRSPVPPMSDERVIIEPRVEVLVLKCLAKQPNDRWSTMDELIQALKTVGGVLFGVSASGGFERSSEVPGIPLATSTSGVRARGEVSESDPTERLRPCRAPGFAMNRRTASLMLAVGAVVGVAGAIAVYEPGTREAARAATLEESASPVLGPSPLVEVQSPVEPTVEPVEEESPAVTEPLPMVRVRLQSLPSGAEVFVNERSYGTTPSEIEWIGDLAEQGRHVEFRFERPGFRPAIVTESIEGELLEVSVRLRPAAAARPRTEPASMMNSESEAPSSMGLGLPGDYRDSPY